MTSAQLKRLCAKHGYECYRSPANGWTVYPLDFYAEASYHTAATLRNTPNTPAGIEHFVKCYLSDQGPTIEERAAMNANVKALVSR